MKLFLIILQTNLFNLLWSDQDGQTMLTLSDGLRLTLYLLNYHLVKDFILEN
jgi:hypothetical protein